MSDGFFKKATNALVATTATVIAAHAGTVSAANHSTQAKNAVYDGCALAVSGNGELIGELQALSAMLVCAQAKPAPSAHMTKQQKIAREVACSDGIANDPFLKGQSFEVLNAARDVCVKALPYISTPMTPKAKARWDGCGNAILAQPELMDKEMSTILSGRIACGEVKPLSAKGTASYESCEAAVKKQPDLEGVTAAAAISACVQARPAAPKRNNYTNPLIAG